ncbi:MAG: TIGR02302 family protein, partial [Pseudomonadota bacterium]|nr:TIGR02302 family protein [Pseudomonadota bacterium]
AGATIREFKTTLDKPLGLKVTTGGRERAVWRFAVEPDLVPTIRLAKPPEQAASGALKLNYAMTDDYGVVQAEARVERVEAPAPILGPKDRPAPRALYEAPRYRLGLPQARVKQGNGETLKDLSEHPWAGARVRLLLAARDEAGQEGTSAPHEMRLPERPFRKPLARAVVEQRRALALDAESRELVIKALEALSLDPEKRFEDTVAYLGLRSAYHRLRIARTDEDLRSVVGQLWQVALRIEDGDLSAAERDLRAAEEALRRALEEGASDKEIERLMQELREALNRYMQQMLAEAMRRPPEAMPPNANTRMVRPQDLERMMKQIENLARSGARDAARQMLSELRNMLENLRTARPMQGQQNPMNEALNRLQDMIREQQRLMNETFRQGQQGRPQRGSPQANRQQRQGQQRQGQPQQAPGDLAEQLRRLQQQQEALRQQLEDMMRQMEQQGMQPGNKLGEAGEAMEGAEQALGQGESEDAVGQQGRALENLRAGAEGLAQQMRDQMGQGPGRGPETGFADEDPLGRPRRTDNLEDGPTKVPGEIETQRARQILEELRRRLGEPARPRLERDYLERLLDRI